MDLREQPHGTGPSGDGIALPQTDTVKPLSRIMQACLLAAVRGRGMRHIGQGRYAVRHFHELEPARAWEADTLTALAKRGLLEFVCTAEFALPTDAAYRLLDGVA